MSPTEAFGIIKQAWIHGRPIVPLFGAGISAASGIPLTPAMVDYLAKVHWQCSAGKSGYLESPRDTADYLLRHGWPDLHELNTRILHRWEEARDRLEQLNDPGRKANQGRAPLGPVCFERDVLPGVTARVLRELNLENDPNKWLFLLQRLSDGNQELKDLFFARLEHGRRPSTSHQFVAYLTGLMGWKLILTTNFDSLIEQALRSQSIDPVVYELSETGPVPDPRLVDTQLSLLKLHGGAYGRLMSETLMYSLRGANLNRLLAYFPKNPLILVLGYGGGDERVMSLLRAIVEDPDNPLYTDSVAMGELPRLLWIHRTEAPPLVNEIAVRLGDSKRLATARYRNGARFLQELYSRLTTTHPVSTTSYRAFPQMAPETDSIGAVTGEAAPRHQDQPVVVYHSGRAGNGTSLALAQGVRVKSLSKHDLIWCDLGSISTVDGLITYLQNRFRRYDPGLPPFAFFQTGNVSLSVLPLEDVPATRFDKDRKGRVAYGLDPRIRYLVHAMRRGRYLIAIDSLGEFGTSFFSFISARMDGIDPTVPELRAEREHVKQESRQLWRFLEQWIECSNQFGESRLHIAHTSIAARIDRKDSRFARGENRFVERLRRRESAHKNICFVDRFPRTPLKEFVERGNRTFHVQVSLPVGARLAGAVRALWEATPTREDVRSLVNQRKFALALCACFRRRRDLVILRQLFLRVFAPGFRVPCTSLNDLFEKARHFQISALNRGIGHKEQELIDTELNNLHPLLVGQESGFYWMHRVVRDEIYRRVCREVRPDALAGMHDLIAGYYYTGLFRPSNEPAALFEYFFHRLLSLPGSATADFVHRLRDLVEVLKRERDHLLRDTHAGALRRFIDQCRCIVFGICGSADSEELADIRSDIRRKLCELEAEADRQAAMYDACIDIRCRQIEDRVTLALPDSVLDPIRDDLHRCVEDVRTNEPSLWRICGIVLPALQSMPLVLKSKSDTLLRLLDHLIDIAVCHFSDGREERALAILRDVRHACEFTMNPMRREFASIRQMLGPAVIDLIRQATNNRAVQSQVNDVRVRCAFRLMAFNLASINPWADADRSAALKEARNEYSAGQTILQEYTGWEDRNYDHYVCFLNTLRARAAYLSRSRASKGEFALAYEFLDAGRAAIRRPHSGSDCSALAILLLHKAECLMLHADADLRYATKSNLPAASKRVYSGTTARGRFHGLAPAKVKLDRARTVLAQACAFLVRGRPQVWAWTWLRILEAQLEHEETLWWFERETASGRMSTMASETAHTDFQFHRAEAIRKGLAAIRTALDSCGPGFRRREQSIILWWQFFVCFGLNCRSDKAIPEWVSLNDEFGLDSMCDANAREIRLVGESLPSTVPLAREMVLFQETRALTRAGMPLHCARPRAKQPRHGAFSG